MSDDWGRDPSVRFMRRVFENLEETQERLWTNLKISPFDVRLRDWRDKARDLFEHVWPLAMRQGVVSSEEEAGLLYLHCLLRTLNSDGIKIPDGVAPLHEGISKLIREVPP